MLMYHYHLNTDSWKSQIVRYMCEKQKHEQQKTKQAGVLDCIDLRMIWELNDDKFLNEKEAMVMCLYVRLQQCEYACLTHDDIQFKRSVICVVLFVFLCVVWTSFVCFFVDFVYILCANAKACVIDTVSVTLYRTKTQSKHVFYI